MSHTDADIWTSAPWPSASHTPHKTIESVKTAALAALAISAGVEQLLNTGLDTLSH